MVISRGDHGAIIARHPYYGIPMQLQLLGGGFLWQHSLLEIHKKCTATRCVSLLHTRIQCSLVIMCHSATLALSRTIHE